MQMRLAEVTEENETTPGVVVGSSKIRCMSRQGRLEDYLPPWGGGGGGKEKTTLFFSQWPIVRLDVDWELGLRQRLEGWR